MFIRNKKGQSALEYAILITVLALAAFAIVNNVVKPRVDNVYNSAGGKIDASKGWLDSSMSN